MLSQYFLLISNTDELNVLLQRGSHYFNTFAPSAVFIEQHDPWFQDILQTHHDDAAAQSIQAVQQTLLQAGYTHEIPILLIHGDVTTTLEKLVTNTDKSIVLCCYDEARAQQQIATSACSIMLIQRRSNTAQHLIIPIDLSQASDDAVNFAKEHGLQEQIELLYVEHIEFGPMDNLFDAQSMQPALAADALSIKTQDELFALFLEKHQLKGSKITQFSTLQSDIANYINEQHASLAILSQHDKPLFIDESITYAIAPLLACDVIVLKA